MRKEERIKENLGAADIELSGAEYTELKTSLDRLKVYGDRKDEDITKLGDLRKEKFGSTGVN